MQKLGSLQILGIFSVLAASTLLTGCSSQGNAYKHDAPLAIEPSLDSLDSYLEVGPLDPKSQIPKFRRIYTKDGDKKKLSRIESDFNADGRIDFVQFFDATGRWVEFEKADLDGDGRFDITYAYQKDGFSPQPRLVQESFDTQYKGRPDLWKEFNTDGSLKRRLVDRNGDGKPDYWEYFEANRVVRVDRDNSGMTNP